MGDATIIGATTIRRPVALANATTAGVVMGRATVGIWFDLNPFVHMVLPSHIWGVGI